MREEQKEQKNKTKKQAKLLTEKSVWDGNVWLISQKFYPKTWK